MSISTTTRIASNICLISFVSLLLHFLRLLPSVNLAQSTIDWDKVKPMYVAVMQTQQPQDGLQSLVVTADEESDAVGLISQKQEPIPMDFETKSLAEAAITSGTGSGIKASDRIFGGNTAVKNCFPYQIGMLLERPKGLYWCGGSLISDQYVLTAAHCIDMAKKALIFLGAHEIKNAKEEGQVRIMVEPENFILYPTWNPKRLKDDIALVRLPYAIEYTDRIHPIELPKRSYEFCDFENKLGIATGWGRYASGVRTISNVLRYARLSIIDGQTCKIFFPFSYRSTNVCTSGHKRSTCNGDSGGPLVLQRKRSKERVLVGITSFGSIFGCDRGFPAAFTKVAAYLDWITDMTGMVTYKPELPRSYVNETHISKYLKQLEQVARQRQRNGASDDGAYVDAVLLDAEA